MAQSPDFPEYRFVQARHYDRGRAIWPPRLIVIHTTEGSEGYTSAEDGAAYDARRSDLVSTHFFVDRNSVVQTVRIADTAFAAFYDGNARGIQIELCGTAGQSGAQWRDAASSAELGQAAALCAKLAIRYSIPVRHITGSALDFGKGFCGHVDISRHFEGDHTDPGVNFPWSSFLADVARRVASNEGNWLMGLNDAESKQLKERIAYLTTDVAKLLGAPVATRRGDVDRVPPNHTNWLGELQQHYDYPVETRGTEAEGLLVRQFRLYNWAYGGSAGPDSNPLNVSRATGLRLPATLP